MVFAALGLAVFSLAGLLVNIPQYQRTTPMISTPNAVLIISGKRSISGYPVVMAMFLMPSAGPFDMIM
ncbi:Uncharacterised protein [Mycobacteroides abscessus subsp. massiliense]|nr:Uncharacterised protein [Mycobacteroides abscessus subsp. massiliense]